MGEGYVPLPERRERGITQILLQLLRLEQRRSPIQRGDVSTAQNMPSQRDHGRGTGRGNKGMTSSVLIA